MCAGMQDALLLYEELEALIALQTLSALVTQPSNSGIP